MRMQSETAATLTETTFEEVVRKGGGLTTLANALGEESVQVVSNWRHRGFPANRCMAIQALTGVSVRRLRPDDWADYWPESKGRE